MNSSAKNFILYCLHLSGENHKLKNKNHDTLLLKNAHLNGLSTGLLSLNKLSEQHYLNVGRADSLDERVHHFASYLDLSWGYHFHNLNESFSSL